MTQGTYTLQAGRPGQQLDKGRKGSKNVMYCGGRKQTSRGGCRGLCSRLRIKLTSPMCIPSGHLLVIQRLMAQTAWFIDPSQRQHQGRSPSARPQESGLAKASHPMGGVGWAEQGGGRATSARVSLGGKPRKRATVWSTGSPNRQPCSRRRTPGLRLANGAGFVSSVIVGAWG